MTDAAPTIEVADDLDELAAFLGTERARFAYELGDLDPLYVERCRFWGARRGGALTAVVLRYEGCDPPAVLGQSTHADQRALWDAVLPELPAHARAHFVAGHEVVLARRYGVRPIGTHLRLRSDPARRVRPPDASLLARVRVMTPADQGAIRAVHAAACDGPVWFDTRTLERGLAVGLDDGDGLAAFAGCHVHSPTHGVAMLGAIATHPRAQRRGYGAAVTAALTDRLHDDVACVALNVAATNAPARSVYERLGYACQLAVEEAWLDLRTA